MSVMCSCAMARHATAVLAVPALTTYVRGQVPQRSACVGSGLVHTHESPSAPISSSYGSSFFPVPGAWVCLEEGLASHAP